MKMLFQAIAVALMLVPSWGVAQTVDFAAQICEGFSCISADIVVDICEGVSCISADRSLCVTNANSLDLKTLIQLGLTQ